MSEIEPKKMVRRSVAIALGIICIILIALIAYFSVTGISSQNSYNNLQSKVNDLTDTLDLNKSIVWVENKTMSLQANQDDQVMFSEVPTAGFILVRTSSTTNNTYVELWYHAALQVANGTFYEYPLANYDYYKKVSVESYEQDNVFPILPSSTTVEAPIPTVVYIFVGNTSTVEDANVTISIAYCY